MNTKRTLAIAVSLAGLVGAGLALANEPPGRGHGPQAYYGQHQQRHDHRFGHKQREERRQHYDRKRDKAFDRKIERRQDKQEARIRKGLRSGDLTREEFARLQKQQQRIERLQQRFDDDGRYSKAERERMKAALQRADRAIRRQRHDDDERYRRRDAWWGSQDRYGYSLRWDRPAYPGYYIAPWQRWAQ